MTAAHLIRLAIEAAVLAGLVAAACRFVPRIRAGHKAMLWWLVSAKLLVGLAPLPVLELAALPAAPAREATAARTAEAMPAGDLPAPAPAQPPDRSLAAWAWLAAASLLVASAIPGWRRARAWRRRGLEVSGAGRRLAIARAARAVGLWRAPSVLAVSALPSPLVTGLFRPCVLVPAEALERWSPEELEMALAHEMAHVARGDLWWGLVPALARRVFFFHPAAWLAEREYAIAREAACDEAVLGPGGADAFAYGQLLLRFATRAPAAATIPMSPRSMLRRRLEMIESAVHRVPFSRAGWALVAVAALALVPFRLVAEEPTRCLDIGNGEDTAYVITDGASHAMCGELADVLAADRIRGGGEDVIWFRAGGETWVIRDRSAVKEGRRYFDAITEVSESQSEIGEEQSRIGHEQAAIGARQAEQAYREVHEARRRAELDRGREQGLANGKEQVDLERAARPADTARAAASAEADLRMKRLAARVEAISQQMQELSARQAELGEQQRLLGEGMAQKVAEVKRTFSEFLERTMKDGRAQRAP